MLGPPVPPSPPVSVASPATTTTAARCCRRLTRSSPRGSPPPPPPTLRHWPHAVSSALAPAPGFMLLRTLCPTLRRPGMPQYPERRQPPRLWLLSLEQLGLTDLRFVLVEWNAADLSYLGLGMGLGNFSINFGPLILISICCVGFCFPQFI